MSSQPLSVAMSNDDSFRVTLAVVPLSSSSLESRLTMGIKCRVAVGSIAC